MNEPQFALAQLTVQSTPRLPLSLVTVALIVVCPPAPREDGGVGVNTMEMGKAPVSCCNCSRPLPSLLLSTSINSAVELFAM